MKQHCIRSSIISDLFIPQNNGQLSDSIIQNWTEQAIECYKLKVNVKIVQYQKVVILLYAKCLKL